MPELVTQLTRIADALERVAAGQERAKGNEPPGPENQASRSPS